MKNRFQDLSQFKVPPGFRGKPGWYVLIWWTVDAIFFKPSPQPLYGWRVFLLRMFGAKIGKKVIIRPSATITYPWFLEVGDYAWIGDDVVIYNLDYIKIGKHAVVSQKCYLCGGGHDYTKLDFPIFRKSIVVEDEAWLATDVFVSPGITIGKGAIVGARSFVNKNLDGGFVYGGYPVRLIKERKESV